MRNKQRSEIEVDEFFEDTAIAELKRLEPSAWSSLRILWDSLSTASPAEDAADRATAEGGEGPKRAYLAPATAKRIIMCALRLCQTRGVPPDSRLLDALESHLLTDAAPRNRAKLTDQQRDAARYLASHPTASNRAAAEAVGVSHQTIATWKDQERFRLLLEDERARAKSRQRSGKQ
jgi:hypothetical protein